jgi:E3 Ubiquitin ligase
VNPGTSEQACGPNLVTCFSAIFYVRASDVWIWALVGFFTGLYLFYRGFRLLGRKRLIMDTPTSKIRSAAIGMVEVSGLAVGPYTMPAPITAKPCYYYRTTVFQMQQRGKNREWVKVADESLHVPFYLDDNTGQVLVNPQGAELDIHCDFKEEFSNSIFSSKDLIPPNVGSFLARHSVDTDKKIKVEEYCIKPKNALFALGTLAENPGLEVTPIPVPTVSATIGGLSLSLPGIVGEKLTSVFDQIPGATTTTITIKKDLTHPEAQPEVIRLSSSGREPASSADMTQQQRIVAALTKAGINNPAAWDAAGVPYSPAQVTVVESSPASSSGKPGFDLHPKVVLMKGTNNPAFFISWRSQKDVVSSLRWKSALYIWGGPALAVVSAYILAVHFELV